MVQPYIRPIKIERWFVLSIGSSLMLVWHKLYIHLRLVAKSDVARNVSSTEFLHLFQFFVISDVSRNACLA